jgi:hypothetical protein
MLKKLLLILLIYLLIPASMVMASDITDAEYQTVIAVTNNSTTDYSGIAGELDLSVPDMISNDMVNATATDIVIRRSGGVDVPFMPGYDTNPWCVFVPSSYGQTVQNYNMYHGEATGGAIRYFPDIAGMTVPDDASLEVDDNFTITINDIYLNTDNGADENIIRKSEAFRTYISDTVSGNVTVSILATEAARAPNGGGSETYVASLVGAATHWQAMLTNDGDTSFIVDGGGAYQRDLYSTTNTAVTGLIESVKITVVAKSIGGGAALKTAVKTNGTVYDGAETATVAAYASYSTTYYNNPQTGNAWTIAEVNAMEIGVSLKNACRATQVFATVTYESGATVNLTGINSGEYDVTVSANTTHLVLDIGGTSNSTALGGASVPDNANDWVFFENDSTMYAGGTTITIDGVDTSAWAWEYGTTFADSIGSNDATPSFRTAGSTADVILSIASQDSTAEQGEPAVDVSGGWNMIDAVPAPPGELFTEGGTTFPGYAEIDAFATGTRMISTQGLLYILAFLTAGLSLFGIFAKTHNSKMGNKGSLFLGCLTAEVVLMVWVFAGGGVISGLVLIPFGLISILWLLLRNPFSPITS